MNINKLKAQFPAIFSATSERWENIEEIAVDIKQIHEWEESPNADSLYFIEMISMDSYWVIDSTSDPLLFEDEYEALASWYIHHSVKTPFDDYLDLSERKHEWIIAWLYAKHHKEERPEWAKEESDYCMAAIYYTVNRADFCIDIKKLTDTAESIDQESNYDENSFGDRVYRGHDVSTVLVFPDGSLYHSDGGGSEAWAFAGDYESHCGCEIKNNWLTYNDPAA